jgi:hypothetical protein
MVNLTIDRYIEVEVNNIKNEHWKKYINNEYIKLRRNVFYEVKIFNNLQKQKIKIK